MRHVSHNPEIPAAADAQAARRLIEDFAALGPAEQAFAATQEGRAMLDALGGNAPYLAELACRESACLLASMAQGFEPTFTGVLTELQNLPPDAEPPGSPPPCAPPSAGQR